MAPKPPALRNSLLGLGLQPLAASTFLDSFAAVRSSLVGQTLDDVKAELRLDYAAAFAHLQPE
jgi:hypothetical protein